jgi:hypothetical protein
MKSAILVLALALALPTAARAEPAPDWQRQMEDATARLRREIDKALGQVQELLRAVPQYELPQMNDNGDIIIRRKRQPENPWRAPAEQTAAQPI